MTISSGMSPARFGWLGLLVLGLALEGVALYYQYVLDQLPCVLCIHVRMLVFALIMVSVLGLVFSRLPRMSGVLWFIATGIWVWMTERSYQLLGTERGWILGECQMKSGLPDWLALEEWMPWLFQIHEPCGYTPFLLFRITMAEALIVLSFLMTLLCAYQLLTAGRRHRAGLNASRQAGDPPAP